MKHSFFTLKTENYAEALERLKTGWAYPRGITVKPTNLPESEGSKSFDLEVQGGVVIGRLYFESEGRDSECNGCVSFYDSVSQEDEIETMTGGILEFLGAVES